MITSLAILLTLGVQIPDFGGKEQVEQMKKLSFLVGDWKGPGAFEVPGRKIDVESTERVEIAAGGTAMFVVGKHFMKGPNDQKLLIHDAAAMMFFDLATGKFRMRTQLANGLGSEFEVEVKEKGIVWGFDTPTTGRSRFTMNLTEKGEWHEIGERSMDEGKTWTKYMEMTLAKAPK